METGVLPDIEDNPVGLGRQLPGRWEKEASIQAATVQKVGKGGDLIRTKSELNA
jgi:hypothetical protein